MRIKYLLELVRYFAITEFISGIELVVWLQFREFFLSLMTLENDVFGVRYAVLLSLVAIPALFALADYQSKQKEISKALNNFLRK